MAWDILQTLHIPHTALQQGHVTYEVGPTESLILLHSLMMRSQFASPRPLVALTGRGREK